MHTLTQVWGALAAALLLCFLQCMACAGLLVHTLPALREGGEVRSALCVVPLLFALSLTLGWPADACIAYCIHGFCTCGTRFTAG